MHSEYLYGQEHVRRYRETGGELGYRWRRGSEVLLLTTTGRRSGDRRTMPLIFREIEGKYVLVASHVGNDNHPAWYLNLLATPEVELQVRDEVFPAVARVAKGEERERLWRLMNEVWPDYDVYQTRTDRQIPVVVLERA